MMKYVQKFIKDNKGVELIEWMAIIAITAALIGIAAATGTKIQDKLQDISGYL